MFQEGGAANVDERYFFIDNTNNTKTFIDPEKLYDTLSMSDAFTITSFVQNPDVTYSPAAQEILRKIVYEKQSGFSTVDPNTFQFGQLLPDYLTTGAGVRDVAGGVGQGLIGTAEGALNFLQKYARGIGEGGRQRLEEGFVPRDILPGGIGSERMPFSPETTTGTLSDTNLSEIYDRGGMLRQGIPQERLVEALSQAKVGDVITDFTPELEEIITPQTEDAVEDAVIASDFDFRDEDLAARQPKYTMPPDEFAAEQQRKREEQERIQAEIDASPMLSDTLGTIDPVDSAARRAAFLESVEGLDEFGEPIPGFDKRTSMIEDGIAEALQELTPIENVVDIDRTEADSLMDVEDKFEGKFDKPKIDLTKVDTTITAEMEEANKKRDARQPAEFTDKTKGEFREIFGSDRFLDFIRNVGGELVRTGQIGEGLASGAAKAAEERATRDLLAEQEQKKFEREKALLMAKEMFGDIEGLKPSELNALMKNVDELSENVMNYEGTEASIAIMNDAISLFDEAIEKGVPITGLPGRIMRFKDEAAAFLGIDNPNVSDATKIQNYIEQVKQRSIREILNESGRTISNLDRDIVDRVFGGLDLTGDPTEIRKKLYNARANLIKNNRDKQRKITSDYRVLQDPAYQGKGLAAITPYEDLILKIIGLDPSVVTTTAVQSASGPQSATVDIQDISL